MAKRKPKQKLTTKGMQEKLFSILLPVAERFAKQQEEQAKRDAEWRKKHPVPEGEAPAAIPVTFGAGIEEHMLGLSNAEKARTSRDFLQGAQAAALLGEADLAADLVARAKQALVGNWPVLSPAVVDPALTPEAREAFMAGETVTSTVEGADGAMQFAVPARDTLNLLGLRKALGDERAEVLQIDVGTATDAAEIAARRWPCEGVEILVNDRRLHADEKPPFFLWNDDLRVRNLNGEPVVVQVHYRRAPEAAAVGE